MYEREVTLQTAKVQKMKDEGQDEYDIKKQVKYMYSTFLKI